MPNYNYTTDVPNPPNLPSTDVGSMQTNTNSINSWAQVDHFGFNAGNPGGYHKQATFLDEAAPGVPAGLNSVLFSNLQGGNSWPFWQNALGSFQITGSASANNPSAAGLNGWTFLPGGFILQWGQFLFGAQSGTILFATANINFPTNCLFVNSTLLTAVETQPSSIGVGAFATTGFSYKNTGSGGYGGFEWIAIGN